MPAKERFRFNDVSPLSKPLAPPRVVFRDRMKLREIKTNGPKVHCREAKGTKCQKWRIRLKRNQVWLIRYHAMKLAFTPLKPSAFATQVELDPRFPHLQ